MHCKFLTPCGMCSLKSLEGLAQIKCEKINEPKQEPPTPEEILGISKKEDSKNGK